MSDPGTVGDAASDPAADARLEKELSALLHSTADRLQTTGARDEALGEYRKRRGLMGLGGGVSLTPVGRAWRLGVLLLTPDARLFAVGSTTRAVPPRHPNNQSLSGEERRAHRAAAYEGKFPEGEVVNFDYTPLAIDADALREGAGPLGVAEGVVVVEWARGQKRVPLAGYLSERAGLLKLRDGWDERDVGG
jgi:hypothetical protein